MFLLSEILKNHGHLIVPFSMKHERNLVTQYNDFFVSNIITDNFEGLSLKAKLKTAGRIIYSIEARKKVSNLLKTVKPDIAHIHGIYHQISPSILPAFKKNEIPTVMTLHDYKLICPNYKFYTNNQVCEKCNRTKYFQAIINKCVKGSYVASFICCVEMYIHRFFKIYEKNIDIFICPSKWLRGKMIEYGLPAAKLIYIPNFVNLDTYKPSYGSDNYIIYFGRIAVEKGLQTLIKAMKYIKNTRLVIVGEGPVEEELRKYCEQNNIDNCDFVGYKTGTELIEMIRNSKFVILPSVIYENSPMSIFEAFASGKPVIGSNIGGIPELIDDGVNGLLFEPKNVNDLVEKIEFLLEKPKIVLRMGKNARKKVEEEYNTEIHYERIKEVYESLLR